MFGVSAVAAKIAGSPEEEDINEIISSQLRQGL
jgi:hypothetical protein